MNAVKVNQKKLAETLGMISKSFFVIFYVKCKI